MLNIVLVEPEIPQNTGNIARTCTAIGAKLNIIKPISFEISDKSVRRAGLDYWKYLNFEMYENLNDFLIKHKNGKFYFCSTKAKNMYNNIKYPKDTFLFFGSETKGLPENLIFSNKGKAVTIPMLSGIRSLNLSNAVAIVAYEVVRQKGLECIINKFSSQ